MGGWGSEQAGLCVWSAGCSTCTLLAGGVASLFVAVAAVPLRSLTRDLAPAISPACRLYQQVDPNLDFSAIYRQVYKA